MCLPSPDKKRSDRPNDRPTEIDDRSQMPCFGINAYVDDGGLERYSIFVAFNAPLAGGANNRATIKVENQEASVTQDQFGLLYSGPLFKPTHDVKSVEFNFHGMKQIIEHDCVNQSQK